MLKIPKLIVPLDLSGYSPELSGETIQVWVDPPRRLRQEYDALLFEIQQEEIQRVSSDLPTAPASSGVSTFENFLRKTQSLLNVRKKTIDRGEATDVRVLKWYVTLWSQGPEGSALSLVEVQNIENENPAFLGWLIQETWRMIHENQVRLKKN